MLHRPVAFSPEIPVGPVQHIRVYPNLLPLLEVGVQISQEDVDKGYKGFSEVAEEELCPQRPTDTREDAKKPDTIGNHLLRRTGCPRMVGCLAGHGNG